MRRPVHGISPRPRDRRRRGRSARLPSVRAPHNEGGTAMTERRTAQRPADRLVRSGGRAGRLAAGEGEALWFLAILADDQGGDRGHRRGRAAIEHLAPRGSGSPLHVHHHEDEWFYITEGELPSGSAARSSRAGAGSFIFGPRDIPHTFAVSSETARFLMGAHPAGSRSSCGPSPSRPPSSRPRHRRPSRPGRGHGPAGR